MPGQMAALVGLEVGEEGQAVGVDLLAQHGAGRRVSVLVDGREHHRVRLGHRGGDSVRKPRTHQRKPALGDIPGGEIAVGRGLVGRPGRAVVDTHTREVVTLGARQREIGRHERRRYSRHPGGDARTTGATVFTTTRVGRRSHLTVTSFHRQRGSDRAVLERGEPNRHGSARVSSRGFRRRTRRRGRLHERHRRARQGRWRAALSRGRHRRARREGNHLRRRVGPARRRRVRSRSAPGRAVPPADPHRRRARRRPGRSGDARTHLGLPSAARHRRCDRPRQSRPRRGDGPVLCRPVRPRHLPARRAAAAHRRGEHRHRALHGAVEGDPDPKHVEAIDATGSRRPSTA